MKTLYLLRHAKSDWSHVGQPDFDRGINERGRKSIKKIWEYLAKENIHPDMIVSSPAKRAKITAQWIADYVWYSQKKIQYRPEIYDTHQCGYEWVLSCILDRDNSVEHLFLVGHNYAITDLAEFLCGEIIENMPTCSMVTLQFDIDDWMEVTYKSGKLLQFIKPKNL